MFRFSPPRSAQQLPNTLEFSTRTIPSSHVGSFLSSTQVNDTTSPYKAIIARQEVKTTPQVSLNISTQSAGFPTFGGTDVSEIVKTFRSFNTIDRHQTLPWITTFPKIQPENRLSNLEGERDRMAKRFQEFRVQEETVPGDGNCMMRAISHQLDPEEDNHLLVRRNIVKWLEQNEDFPVDTKGTQLKSFLDTDQYSSWSKYCSQMANPGTWGDHLALVGASEFYNATIWILSSVRTPPGSQPITVVTPIDRMPSRTFRLSHWHEAHYNSLRLLDSDPL
eukprot:TRINITY_DN13585_c0_g1_i1.p1 TRINITY_DN13585_c0_g1~~TRINITY_DN13585_c0_g1_i1.p1  ORF type:complete len:278 (-),score=31.37 TRINITY_DN13585_c0_g1_i1:124-957(-)